MKFQIMVISACGKKLVFSNKIKQKLKNDYSVLNDEPHEQLFVTFGLLILKPEPIRLSI